VVIWGCRGKEEQEFEMKYATVWAGFNSGPTALSTRINTYAYKISKHEIRFKHIELNTMFAVRTAMLFHSLSQQHVRTGASVIHASAIGQVSTGSLHCCVV
jgi:hypothetical protein